MNLHAPTFPDFILLVRLYSDVIKLVTNKHWKNPYLEIHKANSYLLSSAHETLKDVASCVQNPQERAYANN